MMEGEGGGVHWLCFAWEGVTPTGKDAVTWVWLPGKGVVGAARMRSPQTAAAIT